MISLGTVILQALACLGLGASLLRALGLSAEMRGDELVTWGFALGFGLLGWLLFFFGIAGLFSTGPLLALLIAGAAGVLTIAGRAREARVTAPDLLTALLLAALAVALVFDILEGIAPPADADSLAYHFDIPKLFLQAGRIEFIPRAVDGAIPMLVEMTYVPALALGGELGLTLWTMVSGWAASALLYAIARRFLDAKWSLLLAVVLLTTPAVLYGGGTGQTEIRIALFAMIAAFAAAEARRDGDLRYAVLAGLGAGFLMASKYTGLLPAFAVGLLVLLNRGWFRPFVTFAVVAVIAGGQWYVWNWLHTGDPVFPILTNALDLNSPFWDTAHKEAFSIALFAGERAVPANLLWLIAYPFVATFAGYPAFESGRTGLGPFVILILPAAVAGVWHFRRRLTASPLLAVGAIVAISYVLWFLTGSSQRVRHLLPIYPLLLICVTVAAQRWAAAPGARRALWAAALATIAVHLAGDTVFAANYVRRAAAHESRDAFLERNVRGYAPVPWINRHLGASDRVFLTRRELNYLIDVPIFYGTASRDVRIDISHKAGDVRRFWRQLRAQHVTHLLVSGENPPRVSETEQYLGYEMWRTLLARNCLEKVRAFKIEMFKSRTLDAGRGAGGTAILLKLRPDACDQWAARP